MRELETNYLFPLHTAFEGVMGKQARRVQANSPSLLKPGCEEHSGFWDKRPGILYPGCVVKGVAWQKENDLELNFPSLP